jgi:rSAM/selenodomain-associated transferase 1
VFAKAPAPGRVKTRLAPLLGAEGAARLHARLVARAVRTALAARCGPVELHCDPHPGHAFFRALSQRTGVPRRAQHGADLGERMFRALRRALRAHRAAVLVGSDCPALRAADLRRAVRLLAGGAQAVLAPAEDGGYALVGVKRVSAGLFEGVSWGGPDVMQETRMRLQSLGWRWRELRTLWDVDRPQDYRRLAGEIPPW